MGLSDKYEGDEIEEQATIEVNERPEMQLIRFFQRWRAQDQNDGSNPMSELDIYAGARRQLCKHKAVYALDEAGVGRLAAAILTDDIRSGIYLSAVHNLCPVDGFTLTHDTVFAGFKLGAEKALTVGKDTRVDHLGWFGEGTVINNGAARDVIGDGLIINNGSIERLITRGTVVNTAYASLIYVKDGMCVNTGSVKKMVAQGATIFNFGSLNDASKVHAFWLTDKPDDYWETRMRNNYAPYNKKFGLEVYVNTVTGALDICRKKMNWRTVACEGIEELCKATQDVSQLMEDPMKAIEAFDWGELKKTLATVKAGLAERYVK